MKTITKDTRHDALHEQINESFQKASEHQERLKRAERRYGSAQATLTGISGLTAGIAAATGHPAAGDWRLVCAAAAVFAFGATATTAAQKQRSDPELLEHVTECVGKLRSLRVDAVVAEESPEALSERYRRLLAEYERVDL